MSDCVWDRQTMHVLHYTANEERDRSTLVGSTLWRLLSLSLFLSVSLLSPSDPISLRLLPPLSHVFRPSEPSPTFLPPFFWMLKNQEGEGGEKKEGSQQQWLLHTQGGEGGNWLETACNVPTSQIYPTMPPFFCPNIAEFSFVCNVVWGCTS